MRCGLSWSVHASWEQISWARSTAVADPLFSSGEGFGSDEGKFLLTAGFSDLEGSGGGGLVPLAFITGYGSSDSWGANAHFTNIQLKDFQLRTYGAAVGKCASIASSFPTPVTSST